MTLDLIQTVAFAGAALFLGYGIKKHVPLLFWTANAWGAASR